MLEIEYPIILGHLYWLGQGELAAAVSEAGGLGVISAGWFKNKTELEAGINSVRVLTRRPLGLAVTVGPDPAWKRFIEAAVEARLTAVFTTGPVLPEIPMLLKPSGVRWIPYARTLEQARESERLGADAVTVEGTPAFLGRVADALGIPVICAGQVCDGRTFLSTLSLGVEGAQITTRFVATRESIAHWSIKTAILDSLSKNGTGALPAHLEKVMRSLQSGCSQTKNDEGIDEFDRLLARAGEEACLKIAKEEAEKGLITGKPGYDLSAAVPTVKEVTDALVKEALEARARVADFLSPAEAQLQPIPYPF
ncbi:MAG: nitronate monooxygenase [Firmicutes bacterium]|nr:nitronate monooxygenase [Bacillota bacterium]